MPGQLYLSGLVSGIDSSEWISKVLDIHKASIADVQGRQKRLETKKTAWAAIGAQLTKWEGAVTALRSRETFVARKVLGANTAVAEATVAAGAAVGSHQIEVVKLAQTHAIASGGVADAGAALGVSGTITIAGTGVDVAATDTLYTLRDRINNAVSAVSAKVVQVATGSSTAYQLVVTAKASGRSKAITLSESAGAGTASLVQAGTAGIATVTLTDSSAAAAGVHRIEVEQAATFHQAAGTYVADPAGVTFTGKFTLNGVLVDVSGGVDLNGLAAAINAGSAGVSAAVANDANGYRLELTSQTMGAGGALTVDQDFDGVLQDAGVVNANLTFRKELQAAQDGIFTVNGQRYERGYNSNITDVISGVTLNIEGTGETTVEVGVSAGGVLRALGIWDNAGSLANELSQAQDAEVVVNGRRYLRGDNDIDDILDQVNLTLAGVGKSSLTVTTDTDSTVKKIQTFVGEFNKTLDVLDKYARYDKSTKSAGTLFADSLVSQIRRGMAKLADAVIGLPTTLNAASQVGLTTGKWDTADYGKLQLNEETLREQLQTDPEGVAKLFGAVRVNVAAATEGASATASSNTTAAPDVLNGDTSTERWGASGGGWESVTVPTSTSPEYLEINFGTSRTIDEVVVSSLGGTTTYPSAENALRNYALQYWDGSQWQTLENVEANTQATNIIKIAAINTRKMRLEITDTNGGKQAQVLEVEAYQVNDGLASRMSDLIQLVTGDRGIDARTGGLNDLIKGMEERVERLQDRMTREERRLRVQFAGLEKTMARFQNQGMMLAGMIGMLGK